MIHTFKFKPKFSPDSDTAKLGKIPAGRILKSEPIIENGEPFWLVVVDDEPDYGEPRELYAKQAAINAAHASKP